MAWQALCNASFLTPSLPFGFPISEKLDRRVSEALRSKCEHEEVDLIVDVF